MTEGYTVKDTRHWYPLSCLSVPTDPEAVDVGELGLILCDSLPCQFTSRYSDWCTYWESAGGSNSFEPTPMLNCILPSSPTSPCKQRSGIERDERQELQFLAHRREKVEVPSGLCEGWESSYVPFSTSPVSLSAHILSSRSHSLCPFVTLSSQLSLRIFEILLLQW